MAAKRGAPTPLGPADLRAARRRADEKARTEPRALSARYDEERGLAIIELTDGVRIEFPPPMVQALAGATPEQLGKITVLPFGIGLVWDELGVDFSTSGLLVELLGQQPWRRELTRKAGSASSEAKAAAARENGKRGGRPRKAQASAAKARGRNSGS